MTLPPLDLAEDAAAYPAGRLLDPETIVFSDESSEDVDPGAFTPPRDEMPAVNPFAVGDVPPNAGSAS
jgi:hypothetical protein